MQVDENTIANVMNGLVGVQLTCSSVVSNKRNKQAEGLVEHNFHSDQGCAKTTVRNIDARWTKGISAVQQMARIELNKVSFPAGDGDAWRLCPSHKLMDLITTMNEYEDKMKAEVEKLVACYDEAKEHSMKKQGDLWRPELFPSIDEMRTGFNMTLHTKAVPLPSQTVRGLSPLLADALKDGMTQDYLDTVQGSIDGLVEEVMKIVQHTVTRIDEWKEGNKIKGLCDRVRELAERIDLLNITDQTHLRLMAEGLREWAKDTTADKMHSKVFRELKKQQINQTATIGNIVPETVVGPAFEDTPSGIGLDYLSEEPGLEPEPEPEPMSESVFAPEPVPASDEPKPTTKLPF